MELSRRGFLGSLIGGVAAAAAIRTFPFRIFSFPEQIIISKVMHPHQIITGMCMNGSLAQYLDGVTRRPSREEIESYLGESAYRNPILYGPDWKPINGAMRWETKTFQVPFVEVGKQQSADSWRKGQTVCVKRPPRFRTHAN